MKYILILFFSVFMKEAFCQNNVGIGTNTPASDAVLEMKSSTQGVLVPRLSTTQRLAITNPSNGLMVYDTNYNCFYYYNAPAITWEAMCAGPTSPTQKANVQVYSSKGVSTLINDTIPTTVNGLSLSVTLVDTATVILSSNGNIIWQDSIPNPLLSVIQLYQNSIPIAGTTQSIFDGGEGFIVGFPYPQKNIVWSVSTVIASLPPGVYLFELKAAKASPIYNINYYAACNYKKQNQGIIIAEIIY